MSKKPEDTGTELTEDELDAVTGGGGSGPFKPDSGPRNPKPRPSPKPRPKPRPRPGGGKPKPR